LALTVRAVERVGTKGGGDHEDIYDAIRIMFHSGAREPLECIGAVITADWDIRMHCACISLNRLEGKARDEKQHRTEPEPVLFHAILLYG
jgi:hypothetical protein